MFSTVVTLLVIAGVLAYLVFELHALITTSEKVLIQDIISIIILAAAILLGIITEINVATGIWRSF